MRAHESESVVPLTSASKKTPSGDTDQLDRAGQTILQLLNKAASVAEENGRQAMDMAQKLSHQLRAAEDRIAELEAEVASHQEQAERAEQWLHKVYTQIEDRFLSQDQTRVEVQSDNRPYAALEHKPIRSHTKWGQ
jgi:hypothetical protein